MATQNASPVSWLAPEFRHYEKNAGWYVTLFAIAILIVGFFIIIQKDIFAAITIAILAILLALFARHKPEMVEIQINQRGVHFGKLFFPYKQINHFWIVHNEYHKTVNLETTAYLNNLIILELEGQEPERVRMFLLQYLPEHENTQPTFPQRVMHKLKF